MTPSIWTHSCDIGCVNYNICITAMDFIRVEGDSLIIKDLFNEEHAIELLQGGVGKVRRLVMTNVGVKVMRLVQKERSR